MSALVSVLVGWLTRSNSFIPKNKHNVPLPPHCHLELSEADITNRPIFIIGDVHGCYDELRHLLFKARSMHSNTLFIFVGDLVNKGPKSAETLAFVRCLSANGDCFSVRGNHDEVVLRECLLRRSNPDYEPRAKYKWTEAVTDEDIEFLKNLPYTISIPSLKTLVVHAGIVPGTPLPFQNLNDLVNMRNIVQEDYFEGRGIVPVSDIDLGSQWAELWSGPDHVYFGHDARRGLQLHSHATGLDTGCLYGGDLTGVFARSPRRFISVKSFHTYKKASITAES